MKKKYEIFHPSYGTKFEIIEAYDEEDAAEDFARDFDSDGDYTIANGSDEIFLVRLKGTKEWTAYEVCAEQEISYHSGKTEIPAKYLEELKEGATQ
jgi:hypothetical protein